VFIAYIMGLYSNEIPAGIQSEGFSSGIRQNIVRAKYTGTSEALGADSGADAPRAVEPEADASTNVDTGAVNDASETVNNLPGADAPRAVEPEADASTNVDTGAVDDAPQPIDNQPGADAPRAVEPGADASIGAVNDAPQPIDNQPGVNASTNVNLGAVEPEANTEAQPGADLGADSGANGAVRAIPVDTPKSIIGGTRKSRRTRPKATTPKYEIWWT
jgi:hypothetical protein